MFAGIDAKLFDVLRVPPDMLKERAGSLTMIEARWQAVHEALLKRATTPESPEDAG